MRINRQGLDIIKGAEGLQLESYPDPASELSRACRASGINPLRGGYRRLPNWESLNGDPWTNGYGHTGPDVKPGLTITEEKASDLLMADVGHVERGVDGLLLRPVTVNQFSALVCFAYNVGLTALAKSTLIKRLDENDIQGAADEFPKWNKSKGVVLPGLVARRAKERELFLTPDGEV